MSEGIVTTTITPESGTTYLEVSDLRQGTERYPGLWVEGGSGVQLSDLVLEQMISDASVDFDRATGDHFLPTTGYLIVDGPTVDGFGQTGRLLLLPRRIRTVSEVAFIDTDGTTTEALDATTYRVHSSTTNPETGDLLGGKGFDGVEFMYGRSYDSVTFPSFYGYGSSWRTYPRSVKVTGTFDWATTPEDVKMAVAWRVLDWAKAKAVPPRTSAFNSGRAQIQINTDTGETGIEAWDRAVRKYRRPSLGLLPI